MPRRSRKRSVLIHLSLLHTPRSTPPSLSAALLRFISFACGVCLNCTWPAICIIFTVYTWPLGTHARTQLEADPAHTHTCTGRPFLSSCRCGRVPNDIFYTLFLGSLCFVPLDKA